MNNYQYMSDQFDTLLCHYFQSQEPDPAFIAQLRPNLLTTASETERARPGFSWNWPRRNWRYAVAAALLLIIVTVTAIGPARVWAQIENWIAYLPGLGRVELSGTRVLEEPVFHSEDGITFEVEQFVASPAETIISIHITGLPADVSPFSGSIYIQWDDPEGKRNGVGMRKAQVNHTFPPCPSEGCPSDIQPDGYDMSFVYEPLPLDINQVQVQWLTYGMVPGANPGNYWTLDIPLTQISEENAQDLLQTGYSLLYAEDSKNGVKITIDRVFLGTSRTVIDSSILVPEPASLPNPQGISLSTETGDLLELSYFSNDLDLNGIQIQTIPSGTPGVPALRVWPTRWQFNPIDIQVSRMTLTIESVDLNYDSQAHFEIETGQDPEVGTVIPLDVNFDVDGFPLHIHQAQIVMAPASSPSGTNQVMAIEFTLDSSLSVNGKSLRAVWFSRHDGPIFAQQENLIDPVFDRETKLSIGRLLLDPYMIRDGKIKVAVDSVVLEQQGPWVISWEIPQEAP